MRRRAAVEDAGDGRVIHHRQRLTLGVEAHDHLRGVHPRLDDLQRYLAFDGLGLFGEPYLAHSAFTDLPEQAVRADGFLERNPSRGHPRGVRVGPFRWVGWGVACGIPRG